MMMMLVPISTHTTHTHTVSFAARFWPRVSQTKTLLAHLTGALVNVARLPSPINDNKLTCRADQPASSSDLASRS